MEIEIVRLPTPPSGEKPQTVKPFCTIEDAARFYLPVSAKAIRGWIADNKDGFESKCVVRRGGRVFIDVVALFRWMVQGKE
jgi:hypothetical protein